MKLCRRTQDRVLAGVASGIADHLKLPVLAVRAAFIILTALSGLGVVLYLVFWIVLPVTPESFEASASHRKGRDFSQLVGFAAIAGGAVLLTALVGDIGVSTYLGWLIALVIFGGGIIWQQAEPDRWRRWGSGFAESSRLSKALTGNGLGPLLLRIFGGGLLMIVGVIGIIALVRPIEGAGIPSLINGLIFALFALAGLALAIGPLLWRVAVQLRSEREGRIRERERAEFAALVHDQVLHTLALVQKNADDPKLVLRLARGQERTLRNWLYKPMGSPDEQFASAMEAVAAEIEANFSLEVDVVVVGDCLVDEQVGAIIQAAREAMINAGRHSESDAVSVYAEVEPTKISVFVRDRGVGFDPDDVSEDRHGVRNSIVGRMERHGGTAEIRSAPGEGTEVRLMLRRSDVAQ